MFTYPLARRKLSIMGRRRKIRFMQRTDLMDTSLEMHLLRIKLLRQKGPEWRIRKTFELCEELRELKNASKTWSPTKP